MFKIRVILVSIYLLLVCQGLFSSNGDKNYDDRIIFFSDRDLYIAGEKALISVNFINNNDKDIVNSQIAYVVLRNEHQAVVEHFTINMSKGKYSGAIKLSDTLSTGYYQILVFTNYSRNFFDRTAASKQIIVVNRFDKDFYSLYRTYSTIDSSIIENQPNSYVNIEIKESKFNPLDNIEWRISSSVFDEALINISVVPREAILHKIYTQSNHLNDQKTDKITSYPKELGGTIVSGYLYDKYWKTPINGGRLFLSTIDTVPNLTYTTTDSRGRFLFNLSFAYLGKEVFIIPDTSTYKGMAEVTLDYKYKVDNLFKPQGIEIDSLTLDYIIKSQKVVRAQKSYNKDTTRSIPTTIEDFSLPKIYFEPNYSYRLSDYVPLDNFNEISREIIPYIRVRGRLEQQSILLQNAHTSFSFFQIEPIKFVNGLPIGNTNRLLNLGSERIRTIEIVNRPWHYGELYFNGILSVVLNETSEINEFLPDNSVPYTIDSFEDEVIYNGNLKGDLNSFSDQPDFRQVLFWKPSIQISRGEVYEFNFISSHLHGEFVIFISGYSKSGEFFWDLKTFEVR